MPQPAAQHGEHPRPLRKPHTATTVSVITHRPCTQGIDLDDLDPDVWGATSIRACSVCDQHIENVSLDQAWISIRTSGADVLPLLVNACSTTGPMSVGST